MVVLSGLKVLMKITLNVSVKFPLGRIDYVLVFLVQENRLWLTEFSKKKGTKLNRNSEKPGKHKSVTGIEYIERLVILTKVQLGVHSFLIQRLIRASLKRIRGLLPQTNEAKDYGLQEGTFSFNVQGRPL